MMNRSNRRINTLDGDEEMKAGLVSGNFATNRDKEDPP